MKQYTIYKHDDGFYHARNNETGHDFCNGMYQPFRSRYFSGLSDYLAYLGLTWEG